MQKDAKHKAATREKMSATHKKIWSEIGPEERKKRMAAAHAALLKKEVDEAFS